jgi:outer membrane cobalamin receptor
MNKMKHLLMIGMGLFPMLIFGISPPPDSLRTYHLHPIRVIADQASSAISSIKLHQVNEPGSSVFDEMAALPGLSLSMGTKDESNLSIRGFRKNDTLILLDGRPLTAGYFGNVDLSKILLSEVREIAIIKGPASAQYGAGSMGGVVNLITAPAENLLSISSSISRNQRMTTRLASARDWGDIAYSLSVAREDKPGFVLSESFEPTLFENGSVRDHSAYTAWHLDAKTDFRLKDIHELGLALGYSAIPAKDIPSSIYARDYRAYRDYYRSYASLGGDFYTSEQSRAHAHLYYDAAGDTYERYRDANHESLDLSSRMESFNLGFAPGIRIGQNFSSGLRSEYRHTKRKDTGSYLEWTDNYAILSSAYAQYQWALKPELELSLSFGLSSFWHSLNQNMKHLIEPAMGLYWTLPHYGKLAFSLGQNSSMPTMRQLFSAESGNPKLKPSHALKYELNHNRNWGSALEIVSDISLYYNDIKDLIDREGELYQNVFELQTWGGEISLGARPHPKIAIDAGYSYLAYTSGSDYRLSDSAPHSVDITWSW